MSEVMVVGSKVKESIKSKGLNTASDAVEGLSKVVEYKINNACKRCQENGRKTVRAIDF